jgi:hypothetical protein
MLRSDQANAILVPPSAMPKRNAFAPHLNAGTVKSCMLWFGRDKRNRGEPITTRAAAQHQQSWEVRRTTKLDQ